MKKVEYWYWRLRSQTAPHEVTTTQWLISEAEALRIDANAVREPGTLVVRELPETEEEKAKRQRIYDVPRSASLWPTIAALPLFRSSALAPSVSRHPTQECCERGCRPVDAINVDV